MVFTVQNNFWTHVKSKNSICYTFTVWMNTFWLFNCYKPCFDITMYFFYNDVYEKLKYVSYVSHWIVLVDSTKQIEIFCTVSSILRWQLSFYSFLAHSLNNSIFWNKSFRIHFMPLHILVRFKFLIYRLARSSIMWPAPSDSRKF